MRSFNEEIYQMSPWWWTLAVVGGLLVYLLAGLGLLEGLQKPVKYLLAPTQQSLARSANSAAKFFGSLGGLNDLITQRDELNMKLAKSESQLAQVELIFEENKRLIAESGLRFDRDYKRLGAQVVKFQSGDQSSYQISKGSEDGVRVGDVVVVEKILLGRVVSVDSFYSQVQLIGHPESSIPVKTSLRSVGLLNGGGGSILRLEQVLPSTPLEVGDRIFTSGLNSGYPADLYIGKVVSISSDPRASTKSAVIEAAINYAAVEDIVLLHLPQ